MKTSIYCRRLKRVLDFCLGLAFLSLLSPLLALVAVMVKLNLGKPVFFRQERTGLNGRTFTMVKFRTMLPQASTGEELADSERLTRFGSILRSSSLDELPELWNVVKGDMSLVGPRPLLPSYLDRYTSHQARRHEVRPGITGLAQSRHRNNTTWEERLALDVEYVDRASFGTDLRIVIATIRTVVRRTGVSHGHDGTMPAFTGELPHEIGKSEFGDGCP